MTKTNDLFPGVAAPCATPYPTLPSLAALFAAHPDLPRVALSIRQPWCHFITSGLKDIENRSWKTTFRGPVLIHASGGMTKSDYADACACAVDECGVPTNTLPELKQLPRGGIVGVAEIVDCVEESSSPWFFGDFGFVLRNAKPLPFVKMTGRLGIFSF